MVNGLASETEDNPVRDPSLHRVAWPYGSCVGVWYASNRDDRKTCSPPSYDHPLFGLDNAIITPHAAGLTEECAERMGMVSVQNVLDYFAETLNPDLVVNGPF